jgi:hypothetical protein
MNTQKHLLWGIALLLCGCAVSPPEPPQPEGAFRPVNAQPCPVQPEAVLQKAVSPNIQEEPQL